MEAENFSLRWNDFEANISGGLKELRQHSEFFDVTLVVEGGAQVQAHKLILSACSPFFRHVLGSNPHQHPLLYLKGVSKEQVVSILNFMYLGEVNVAQDKLNSFLVVAEDLKVKGLTNNDPGIKSSSTKLGSPGGSSSVSELPPPPKRLKAKSSSMEDIVHIKSEPITGELPSEVGSVASPKPGGSKEPYTVADWDGGVDYHEEGEGSGYGEGVFGHLSHGGLAGNLNVEEQLFPCNQCGRRFSSSSHATRHYHTVHGQPTPVECEVCGKTFKNQDSANTHQRKFHHLYSTKGAGAGRGPGTFQASPWEVESPPLGNHPPQYINQ